MNWAQYADRFWYDAKIEGYDDQYVESCLAYAKRLHERNLPIIFDQPHLAALVGYSITYLIRAIKRPERFYRRFNIAKKSGGSREICEPLPSLKEIQRWILDNILHDIRLSENATAYARGKSILDNCRPHLNQMQVLSLDIRDFFGSIKAERVYGFFQRLGYTKSVSAMLTRLTTLNGSLPQGAPTSPALSNLLSSFTDRRLAAYAEKEGLFYTRYADDMTFSGNVDAGSTIKVVSRALAEQGMALNEKKTRLMGRHERQMVTGLIVNGDQARVPRSVRRRVRQAIHYIRKYGLADHMDRSGKARANYLNHLRGLADFLLRVNPEDRDGRNARELLAGLDEAKII